jgi:hypothetical protein
MTFFHPDYKFIRDIFDLQFTLSYLGYLSYEEIDNMTFEELMLYTEKVKEVKEKEKEELEKQRNKASGKTTMSKPPSYIANKGGKGGKAGGSSGGSSGGQ